MQSYGRVFDFRGGVVVGAERIEEDNSAITPAAMRERS